MRSVLLRRLRIQGSYFSPSALAAACGSLAWGTIAAALTHFSARLLEAEVDGRADGEAAGLDLVAGLGVFAAQALGELVADPEHELGIASTVRDFWGASTTFSLRAASKSAAVSVSPVSGVPPAACIWDRT